MHRNEILLDPRGQAELCSRVEELAEAYTPEWRFDRANPDIGSTLALLYVKQMADNISRINQLPEKYHTEFINMLGLTLQSAHPASGVAVVNLLPGTVSGVALPAGTRLMAEGTDGGDGPVKGPHLAGGLQGEGKVLRQGRKLLGPVDGPDVHGVCCGSVHSGSSSFFMISSYRRAMSWQ